MTAQTHPPLTAYHVIRDNGSRYVTNMAHNVTLDDAREYFLGQLHLNADESSAGTVEHVERTIELDTISDKMRPLVDAVAAAGFRCKPTATYLFFTDGFKIAYLQQDDYRLRCSTVHKPNKTTGTGYAVDDNFNPTPDKLKELLNMFAPPWARRSDLASVVKFKNWTQFAKANKWADYALIVK